MNTNLAKSVDEANTPNKSLEEGILMWSVYFILEIFEQYHSSSKWELTNNSSGYCYNRKGELHLSTRDIIKTSAYIAC